MFVNIDLSLVFSNDHFKGEANSLDSTSSPEGLSLLVMTPIILGVNLIIVKVRINCTTKVYW